MAAARLSLPGRAGANRNEAGGIESHGTTDSFDAYAQSAKTRRNAWQTRWTSIPTPSSPRWNFCSSCTTAVSWTLLRGLVGAGDQLAGILTAAAGTPESLRGMRNFILLTKFFASIPPDVLDSLVRTASAGAEREKAHRAPGVLQLLRRAGSEDSRHAIAVTLDLLESVGKAL